MGCSAAQALLCESPARAARIEFAKFFSHSYIRKGNVVSVYRSTSVCHYAL